LGIRPFGSVRRIRIHELHGNRTAFVRQFHFLKYLGQISAGLGHRKVAALFALIRYPSQERIGIGVVAGADCIFHIRIDDAAAKVEAALMG